MEKINDEVIISSLFMCGYDVVDPYLYTYVLVNIVNKEKDFEYVNEYTKSIYFSNIVDCQDKVFKIKEKSEISDLPIAFDSDEEYKNPVDFLPRSNKLIEFILKMNVEEIVRAKLHLYGTSSYYEYDCCFSKVEKNVRQNVFGSSYKKVVEDYDDAKDPVRILINKNRRKEGE